MLSNNNVTHANLLITGVPSAFVPPSPTLPLLTLLPVCPTPLVLLSSPLAGTPPDRSESRSGSMSSWEIEYASDWDTWESEC